MSLRSPLVEQLLPLRGSKEICNQFASSSVRGPDGVGDVEGSGVGEVDGLGVGVGKGEVVGVETGAAVFIGTPLFQTFFLPDLIQVNVLPFTTEVWPTFLHAEPVFTAASARLVKLNNNEMKSSDAKSLLFI